VTQPVVALRPGAREFLLLLVLSFCWGVAFFFIKVAVETASPLLVNMGRMAVASACLFLLMKAQRLSLPPWGPVWGYLTALAILGNALPYWLIAVAEQQVDSGLASILVGMTPLVTMLLAHVATHDERITPRRAAGFALGFAGLVTLMGPQALHGLGDDLIAQGLLLLACVSFAVNALVARRMPEVSLPAASFGMTLIGTVLMFPIAVAADPGLNARPDLSAIGAMIGLGVISTAAASLLFLTLVRRAGATFVVSANYLTPLMALSLGVLLLGERPDLNALVAFALICGGIWLANRPAGGAAQS